MRPPLYAGKSAVRRDSDPVRGEHVRMLGEDFYCLRNFRALRPFFMTIVSNADHWMFLSSTGALTAGRCDPDSALFPYLTDDKIHDAAETTGPKSLLIVGRKEKRSLWVPFSDRYAGIYRVHRNLYKSLAGNQIIFEETNEDLALTFRYGWFNSERFGFIRKAWLLNQGVGSIRVSLLDGLQNLLPCGIGSQFQLEKSTLIDAYKKNELLPATGLGLFTLSSIPLDRPEPAESLRATTTWCMGLRRKAILLSSRQIERFAEGAVIQQETDVRAERGAYLVQSDFVLGAGRNKEWWIVADVNRTAAHVAHLDRSLRTPRKLCDLAEQDIAEGTMDLRRTVAAADGLQASGNAMSNARHFANTLFNVMRGGLFADAYRVDPAQLSEFVLNANRKTYARHRKFFRSLPRDITYPQTIARAARSGDPHLERLCREFLPLTFSRRHGDPSRPWNRFSIASRNGNGARNLGYEGNWRDIFQNWEALAVSFPGFLPGMVCRFVNASTADGYNPYRITHQGIDWEVPDPSNPWSHIGYWGDHQIIYLLKLLELLDRYDPSTLRHLLTRRIFAFANVPYRVKPYDALLRDPRHTVSFDATLNRLIEERVRNCGADGRLCRDRDGEIYLVNLAEKLLIPVLAKLANFVPEAGIWLNTQRPEWNDANNALVGSGCSMVTLCYLRRHLAFLQQLFRSTSADGFRISREVKKLLEEMLSIFQRHRQLLARPIEPIDRKRVLDELGRAGTAYREFVYDSGFSGATQLLSNTTLLNFLSLAQNWLDDSIRANGRDDGLYHAYNLVRFGEQNGLIIRRLNEMLEGQVATLSSGLLSGKESLNLLKQLRSSRLFRADQHSYLLYPDRQLPRFVEKNNIPPGLVRGCKLIRRLLTDHKSELVERDIAGRVHFNSGLKNAEDLDQCLRQLAGSGYARTVRQGAHQVRQIFEKLFDHESFTGRSGTFFAYEGLGSIYWHMVSKLRLAAQECFFQARVQGDPREVVEGLARAYYDIRSGLGDSKTPASYGAFPMDPYSHTPGNRGACQPGLTGQVKEDLLCRWSELGVFVEQGEIHFRPWLLEHPEFIARKSAYKYFDNAGGVRQLRLPAGALAFTICQTPVVYLRDRVHSLIVHLSNGSKLTAKDSRLDQNISRQIFERRGTINHVVLSLSKWEGRAPAKAEGRAPRAPRVPNSF